MTENKHIGTVSEYEPDNTPDGKKKKSNFIPKICSLLLAIILWFYVIRVDSPTYEKTFDYIPIELTGAQEMLNENGFSVISGYDGVVSVMLSGKQSDINRLKTEEISASVDLGAITISGQHHLPVNITTKSGIKVVGYEPTTLEVYVDSTLQKDVEIRPRITYSKEDNIVLGEYITDPALIKVSGPASVIQQIDHAVTEVDMGKITKSMSGAGTIKLCDQTGNAITNPYLKTNVSSVNVSVPVYKQKYLTPVVKFSDDIIPEKYIDVTFSLPVLNVRGEAEYIDSLSNEIVVATIDPKDITDKSTYEVILKNVDDRLEYLDGQTINIEVSLDALVRNIKRTIPVTLNEANLDIKGVSGKATYTVISPEVLYIEARCVNAMQLDAVTASNITLHADLSTISSSGTYMRDVIVEFGDKDVYASGKYSVTFGVQTEQ